MEYRAVLKRDSNDTFLVTFPDLPGTHTFADTIEEAESRAQDALVTMLEFLIKDRRPIPAPTAGRRGVRIAVPALLSAKIALHNEMLAQRVNKAELGRRLRQHLPQIDRLVDVRHGSKLDQLEAAFHALGKQLEISVRDVAHERRPRRRRDRAVVKSFRA